MTKSWSSFEGQQLLQENWRNFLSEESETKYLQKSFSSDPELAESTRQPEASKRLPRREPRSRL